MYERSRTILSTNIAGFTYHDGAEVFDELKVGKKLSLKLEPDNPFDSRAVAVYAGKLRIGYVPSHENAIISDLLYFGHDDIFEVIVNRVAPENNPERQVNIAIKIKDTREKP
ncbi:MAG: HIRAN domain-containing protein [Coriobacteriia bacterium]|nr:HIRAN domain-containing protein [Coriobacteriia bacterium]MCL2537485.1 HIRAN domain-containing protein [Coriobacteriia bacterium]